MKLFNSLSRKVEEFKPISPESVSLYTCGPTVYSYYHIGNLRNAVFNDTLRRSLQTNGYSVKHVMNVTDVGHLTSDADAGEDKLEKGAKSEGKTVWEVAEYYTESFKNDMAELNILPPNGYHGSKDNYARATDFVKQQVDLVAKLMDGGFAYKTEQAIYFDTSKLRDYGRLAGQKLSDKEVAARPDVVTDSNKKHPQDFAVWFFAVGHFKDHSMRWPSPWGEGFPGWHLECSAIIHATLGDPIDIHTGAVDLIGTHHTNEIAQTEAAFGHPLANYWVHNEYVLIEGKRMAKSAGNFYKLDDIKKKGYDPLALRLLFLQAHYRSQMNFTWEALDGAQSYLKDLQAWADLAHQAKAVSPISSSDQKQLVDDINSSLADDLNSSKALARLNSYLDKHSPTKELLQKLDDAFALSLAERKDINAEQKALISEREEARARRDWARSDAIRDKLLEKGIELNDTPNGPVWRRV